MNRGIYAIIVIGESLSGEKNLILISEIIWKCGKNVIGENKKYIMSLVIFIMIIKSFVNY